MPRNHNVNSPGSSNTGAQHQPAEPVRLRWYEQLAPVRHQVVGQPAGLVPRRDPVRSYTASSNEDLAALGYEKSIPVEPRMGGAGPQSSDHAVPRPESGGTYNNGNLVADLPGVMEIDYVRLWQP